MTKVTEEPNKVEEKATEAPKQATKLVDLSEVQIDKIQKLNSQEQQLGAKLSEVRAYKNDFFELLLDAKGWSPEEMAKVTQVQLNDQNQVVLTMAP